MTEHDYADGEGIVAIGDPQPTDNTARRIARATLRRALMDLRRGSDSARAWLLESEDDPTEIGFSLPTLCDHLGIDASALRKAIRSGWRPKLRRMAE